MGLPGSGKTTLCQKLLSQFKNATHLNADDIRTKYNDWDFSDEGRLRQSQRMRRLADEAVSRGEVAIADFVCPTNETRNIYQPDLVVWMNTIDEGRFEDTNRIFETPEQCDIVFTDWDTVAPELVVTAALKQSTSRKLTKALTWRVLGTGSMVVLALIITGDVNTALSIGAADVVLKSLLYYFHESIWDNIKWGSTIKNQQR